VVAPDAVSSFLIVGYALIVAGVILAGSVVAVVLWQRR
jgi:hypothetical protein